MRLLIFDLWYVLSAGYFSEIKKIITHFCSPNNFTAAMKNLANFQVACKIRVIQYFFEKISLFKFDHKLICYLTKKNHIQTISRKSRLRLRLYDLMAVSLFGCSLDVCCLVCCG